MRRKRLIITIASLVLVVVAAVAAVVGVIAASTQNVTSTLSVSYQAINVRASVQCEYKLQNDSTWTNVGTQSFTPTQSTQNASFTAQSVTLGGNGETGSSYKFNRYVIFRFTITNQYATGQGRSMNSVLSYTAPASEANNKNNIVAWSQTSSATPGSITLTDSDTAWKAADSSYSTDVATVTGTVSIAQNTTKYYYMVVAIANVDLDTAFNSASVQFTLTAVA